jgi:MtN3 and saliva related transmembrane protein
MSLTDYVIEYGFSISLLINAALFIPQIIALIKSKSAKGVSLLTFAGFNAIQIFIMLHGLIIKDYLLAIGYFLSILSCGMVTVLVIYYRYFKK